MSAQPAQFRLPFSHYATLGYQPIPTNGKVPVGGNGWNQRVYTQQEYLGLDATDYNVGLLCSNVVGIDIDVQNAKHAQAIERIVRKVLKLPKDAPRRVGAAPKALFICRVSSPLKGFDLAHDHNGKRSVLFQLLGQGKQFVVDGTHPDTHKPYTLNAPLPKWDKLPEVTPELADVLREAVSALLTEQGYDVHATSAQGKKGTGKFSGPPWTPTGLEQALDALAKLDPDMTMNEWAQVGMALHDGTHGSQEGLDIWDGWSSGGDKYKGRRDCETRWRGFKAGGAVTRASLFKNDWPKVAGSSGEPAEEFDARSVVAHDAAELFDFDAGTVPWVVDELMTYGAHLLAGRPKGGKSWITQDMAYGVGNGGTFLGKHCNVGRVLWIAGEDTKASLSRRLKVRNERPRNISVMTMETLTEEAKKYPEHTFDAWLREYLIANPAVSLVIIDTHATVEARWQQEVIEDTRRISPVELAYQKSRIYEEVGQATQTCIVLVHHTGKLKNNHDLDYHERINMPATVVAGATASFVLADLPDRDQHDEDNHKRIFAMRGRHLLKDTPLLIEMKDGRVRCEGEYTIIRQTEAQAEVFEAIEAILEEQDSTTIAEVAAALGKHKNTVQGALARAKRDGKMTWKGRTLLVKSGKAGGIRWG